MLRNLERRFKRFLSSVLRYVIGSRPVSISRDEAFDRILVIRQHNQLGDMLCVVPLLRALRRKYSTAEITLMASPVNYEIMRGNRYVNSVINFDKKQFTGVTGWMRLVKFVRGLRQQAFDLVLVPSTVSTSFTSDLLAFLSGARVRVGAKVLNGVESPSSFFFNLGVEMSWARDSRVHQTERNLEIGNSLTLPTVELSHEITLSENEINDAKLLLNKGLHSAKLLVIYHPGAGKVPNRWEAARFAALAEALAKEFGVSTLITCGPMDDEPVREMTQRLTIRFVVVRGKPIREVAAILSLANLVISNDTGVMHVAAGVGVPVLSLFGPTAPEQWAPIGVQHRYLRGIGGDINAIAVAEALAAAREMLSQKLDAKSVRG